MLPASMKATMPGGMRVFRALTVKPGMSMGSMAECVHSVCGCGDQLCMQLNANAGSLEGLAVNNVRPSSLTDTSSHTRWAMTGVNRLGLLARNRRRLLEGVADDELDVPWQRS
jgi:hypothetical protein